MTKRIYALLVLLFCVTFSFAQSSTDVQSYEEADAFQDETTESADNYFPPKPKHGTEIGLNLGYHFIHGDVYARPGFAAGLHVRRAFNYTVSWRVQGVYGQAAGLDDRPSNFGNSGVQTNSWMNSYNHNSRLYRNYKTTTGWVSGHFIVNLTNILFHKMENKWNLYTFAGPMLMYHNATTNIFNGNSAYTNGGNPGMIAAPFNDDSSPFKRDKIKFIKNDILDDSYETEIQYFNSRTGNNVVGGMSRQYNILRSNKASLIPGLDVGMGVAYKINDRFNIAAEHQAGLTFNDDLDGHVVGRRTDMPHLTTLKINFNLNPKEGVAPLYWVNPLNNTMEDIDRLKRDKVTLKDSDGDGVLDEFDEEPDTPADYAVDTKGRTLDSDEDGVPNSIDEEPYSPFVDGKPPVVNERGIASTTTAAPAGLTRDQVISLANEKGWDKQPTTTTVVQNGGGTGSYASGCNNWFLPMIHFGLNKYSLNPDAKAQLHQVAHVMKQCPNISVVAAGYTDRLNSNDYNLTLSYNRAKAAVDYLVQVYGISPSRLVINYGGEDNTLVDTNGSSMINRRVEFKVRTTEVDMGAPNGSASGQY